VLDAALPQEIARALERAELGTLEVELQHPDGPQLRAVGVRIEGRQRDALDRAAAGLDRGRAPGEDRVTLRIDRQLEVERPLAWAQGRLVEAHVPHAVARDVAGQRVMRA